MVPDALMLLVALVVILIGAELFTNGIEWFGHHLQLAEGAVGSVLAAVGTAMPETMIPVIAILFTPGVAAEEIGVGAVLGAPFMLATLAMFVTGVAVLFRGRGGGPRSDVMSVDSGVLVHDLRYFALCYAIAIAVAFAPADLLVVRIAAAAVLLGIYGWYVKQHLDADADGDGSDLEPLRLHRLDRNGHREDPARPRLRVVNAQVLVALACIVGGAYAFVGAVGSVSASLGVDETLLALVIAPIATELPEKFNSVIWIRQRKDTLSMGNITGAMVFQSAIPTVIALLFAGAAWTVSEDTRLAFASAGIAFLSVFLIFGLGRGRDLRGRRLLIGGVLYVAYLGLVIAEVSGVAG
jgi:cation:H+ antiporter